MHGIQSNTFNARRKMQKSGAFFVDRKSLQFLSDQNNKNMHLQQKK